MRALILAVMTLASVSSFARVGVVNCFNEQKGYGYIQPIDPPGKKEIFVYLDTQLPPLEAGQCVYFDKVKDNRTGIMKAVNVANADPSDCE